MEVYGPHYCYRKDHDARSFVNGDSDGIVVWLQFVGFFSLVGVRSQRCDGLHSDGLEMEKGTSRSLIMFQGQRDVTRCAASTTGDIEQHVGSSQAVRFS